MPRLTTIPTHRARRRRAAPAPVVAPLVGLGLELDVLEELLTAIGDREDTATADGRARLARGRAALELELAHTLER